MPRFDDESTIRAISRLRREYPYAAALLCYTVAERVLKTRLIDDRRSPELRQICLPKKLKKRYAGKRLEELEGVDSKEFFDSVVCNLTLGELERMLPDCSPDIAEDRNDLVHSNLYLEKEIGTDTTKRDRERYQVAIEHLQRTIEAHTPFRLDTEEDGSLTLRHR